MKKIILIVTGIILILFIVGALASDTENPETASNSQQSTPPTSKTAKYKVIAMSDLQVDIKQMTGEKIEVMGRISVLGEFTQLSSPTDLYDTNSIWVNVDKLPREARKRLIQRCDTLEDGCLVVVTGVIKRKILGPTIVAKEITFK